jgi:hypothetical protein
VNRRLGALALIALLPFAFIFVIAFLNGLI